MYAPLAQLDRASVYGTEGQGFESLTACHENTNPILRVGIFVLCEKGIRTGGNRQLTSLSLLIVADKQLIIVCHTGVIV